VVQALTRDEVRRLRDCGVQIYHPNYEIWDRRLFEILCAGKARFVGHDEWVRRILGAAELFGPANVIPNFVAESRCRGPMDSRPSTRRSLRLPRTRFLHEPRRFPPLHHVVP